MTPERIAEIRTGLAMQAAGYHGNDATTVLYGMCADLLAALDARQPGKPIEELQLRADPFLVSEVGPSGISFQVAWLVDGELVTDNGTHLVSVTRFWELPEVTG